MIAFVEQAVTREPDQEALLREVRDWNAGQYTGRYTNPDDLRDAVTAAVHQLEISKATGRVDEMEMLERARQYIPSERQTRESTRLYLIVAGGPRQQVLRPADIESQDLGDKITDKAFSRDVGFFSRRSGTEPRVENNALILEQEHASILLDEMGTVRLMVSPEGRQSAYSGKLLPFHGLVEEDVHQETHRMLQFAGWILDEIDPLRRLADVAAILVFTHSGYPSWRTRAEYEKAGNSWTSQSRPNPLIVQPTVTSRKRGALLFDTERWVEDLTVLLRRAIRG
ncbi:MAG: hypothetical protein ACR2JW_03400 [Thermomicrobiales bacterium]